MDMYREIILDHYKHPRNFGHLPHASATAHAYNTTCGDKITMEIALNSKKGIEDIRFSGAGCAISQAAASMLTEHAKGKQVGDVMKMKAADIIRMIGSPLTASRTKCATLPLEVLQKAMVSLE